MSIVLMMPGPPSGAPPYCFGVVCHYGFDRLMLEPRATARSLRRLARSAYYTLSTLSLEDPAMKYDHIVLGAGSAGAIVATRLTEDPRRSVLLIEAGPDYPDLAQLPDECKHGYATATD